MAEAGYFAQTRRSPASLAVVVALHAGALAAVIAIKGPQFAPRERPLHTYQVPPEPIPAEIPPPPKAEPATPQQHRSQFDTPVREVDTPPTQGPVVSDPPLPPTRDFPTGPIGTVAQPEVRPPVIPPVAQVVRRAAEFDPRYAAAIQPPYPDAEVRLGREGRVRVRVTIGADGRVKAIHKLSATSDNFWRETERHAVARWRFRPATEDGRPVESTKELNLTFRLEDR